MQVKITLMVDGRSPAKNAWFAVPMKSLGAEPINRVDVKCIEQRFSLLTLVIPSYEGNSLAGYIVLHERVFMHEDNWR